MRIVGSIAILTVFLTSCMDVVDIQTAEAPPLLTVDAWLTNLNETQLIRLTQSQVYFDSSFAEGVQGANITLVVNEERSIIFEDDGSGNYIWTPKSDSTLGNIGDEFILSIELDDRKIQGRCTLNPVPPIDSITQEYREDDIRGADGIYAQFFARDLPGLGDTYWIKTFKNGRFLNKPEEINLAYDAGFDAGSEIDALIFIPPIREAVNRIPDRNQEEIAPYAPGDVIRVEVHSLNSATFDFMTSVRDEILNGNNTIFARPIANTRGTLTDTSTGDPVLGAFNVASVSALEKVIE